jgi:glycerophosphoryl diester phosphodiesterase
MLLLGHRGCRGAFPENTMAAFEHALASGCHGFELDVRRTADGVPVIWHDASLRRRFISRQSYAALCERCRLPGRLPRRPVIELCDLESVLKRFAHRAFMDIELKVRGVEAEVVRLLRRYPPTHGFLLSSFRRPVLLALHRIDPTLPLGLIFDRMPRARVWHSLPIQFVKPKMRLVTPARVRVFHAHRLKVITWTVNQASAMHRLAEAGVDGMIGDDPVALAKGRHVRAFLSAG